MAFKNKTISNQKTGQDIKFIQTSKDTNGKLLVMESVYNEYSKEPVSHYHPNQVEDFTVLTGQLTVRMNGEVKILQTGDTLHIAKNTVHAMWNASLEKTIVQWSVQPALNTEYLLETTTGLATDGKTNAAGMPGILQLILIANKYTLELRLSTPPFILQKILFLLLTPVAYLCGYRSIYKKYLD